MDKIDKRILQRRELEKIEAKEAIKKAKLSREKARKKWSEYGYKLRKKQRRENPMVRLNDQTSNLIYQSIKSKLNNEGYYGWKWEKWVGYTLKDLMNHLENQFNCFMNWENYGKYWVIDHYIPKRLFRFNSVNDEEFKKCWDLKNLRPLEKYKNYYNHLKKEIDIRLESLIKGGTI